MDNRGLEPLITACKTVVFPLTLIAHINLITSYNTQCMRLELVLVHPGQLQLHDHPPVPYNRMSTILHYSIVNSPTSDSTTSIPQTSPRPNASRTASSASISLKACTSTTRLTSYLKVFMVYYTMTFYQIPSSTSWLMRHYSMKLLIPALKPR